MRLATPEAPLLIATLTSVGSDRARALLREGVEILPLPANAMGRVDLTALLLELARRQIISVWVEGGGELHAALLQAGLAHKALFFIAPKLLGGKDAPTPIEGIGPDRMAQAVPLDFSDRSSLRAGSRSGRSSPLEIDKKRSRIDGVTRLRKFAYIQPRRKLISQT